MSRKWHWNCKGEIKLPQSYVELMKQQNGGVLRKNVVPVGEKEDQEGDYRVTVIADTFEEFISKLSDGEDIDFDM